MYLARDLKHDRAVAVKVLRPELAASLGAERFLREIRIAAGLTHPHILPVHDSGEAAGLLYYVMPYVEGESLRNRLRREGPLPIDDALRFAREVADALAYAHSQGVVHRDVKPGNILLVGGHAVVADFGIATAAGARAGGAGRTGRAAEGDTLTELGLAIGTPAYMSPEQAGGRGSVDGRSDLYSLGCVLFEMLTGAPPFTGPTPQAVLARHSTDPAPPVRAVRPSVPIQVDEAVTKALAKLPADRFPTALQFEQALDTAGWRRLSRAPAWGPLRTMVAAVTLVGLLGLIASGLLRRHPTSARTPGVTVAVLPLAAEAGGAEPAGLGSRAMYGALAGAVEWLPGVRAVNGTALAGGGAGPDVTVAPPLLAKLDRAGARYLVTGVAEPGAGSQITVDLYATRSGERVVRMQTPYAVERPAPALARAAMGVVRALAEREGLARGPRSLLLDATSSSLALGHLVEGQSRFWRGDFDAAAEAFRAAIEADSQCALAFHRLSVAQIWRHDNGGALSAAEAGLAVIPKPAPRWLALLDAQRQFVLQEGDSAIAGFQTIVVDDPSNVDGWLGLGEALFHFAESTAHRPEDARPALERVVALDSAFAPIYDHLVDIALYQGDLPRAHRLLGSVRPDDPTRAPRAALIDLRSAGGEAHTAALRRLAGADRYALSEVVALLVRDSAALPLADTVAQLLVGPNRTPDDRRRGAQYRFAILMSEGRRSEAIAAWHAGADGTSFDPWVVLAGVAGEIGDTIAAPMLAWAHAATADGRAPNFTLPPNHEYQQAFQAMVHRAALSADSAEVTWLVVRMQRSAGGEGRIDPVRPMLQGSLDARLALLAGDTVRAQSLLRRAVARIPEGYVTYWPLIGMAPERFLLAQLAAGRRDYAESRRWLASLSHGWSVPDIIYAPKARRLEAQLR